jgi:outer membrane biosynthesis protein TonB
LQNEGDFEEDEDVALLETPTPTPEPQTPTPSPTPTPTPTPSPTPTPTPTPSPTPEPQTPTPSPTPTPTPTPSPTPEPQTPTPSPTPTPTPQQIPTPKKINSDNDNVITTAMYDNSEPGEDENKGPYYVPWKKTSMDLYNKTKETDENMFAKKRYKAMDGYIPGSTIGNVPTDDKAEEKKSDNSKN